MPSYLFIYINICEIEIQISLTCKLFWNILRSCDVYMLIMVHYKMCCMCRSIIFFPRWRGGGSRDFFNFQEEGVPGNLTLNFLCISMKIEFSRGSGLILLPLDLRTCSMQYLVFDIKLFMFMSTCF